MKALIMSCNTGEGHNSAAYAIAEAFEEKQIEHKVVNALSFAPKEIENLYISSLNIISEKVPSVFGHMYMAANFVTSNKRTSIIHYANTVYAGNMKKYILENEFDVAICSHLFPAETLTWLRKRGKLNISSYITATDYTCIPFWEELDMDAWFIPHEDLRAECIERGIPDEKLIVTGIPIKRCFRKRIKQSQARDMIGIPPEVPAFLIMTGGIGCGEATKLTERLLSYVREDIRVIVLTGRSDSLRGEIEWRYRDDARVKSMVFTEQIGIFMDACDVIISKAGGLSTTETAVKGIPLVHVGMIPGCETKNAEFFSRKGMAFMANTCEEAVEMAYSLAVSPTDGDAMSFAQRRHIDLYAAEKICEHILKNTQESVLQKK